ncbi:helicase-related protein [Sphingomonas sp. BIUV-7]|uniref:Transcription-repair-coupling factor n=1 Tax=Sphingomonas natans TaxID=3063330 RepID=A0ABT8YB96_9SPHN|nr:DEAD/DEAH box helicase [Sphingomonas sp. BIUV-7]MDO6415595.1 helicase-related protein [Sphingomonas sp. BIUV-7]
MPAAAAPAAPALAAVKALPTMAIGEVAASLAQALTAGDVLYAATDGPRAYAVARALTAMTEADVIFCPGSDALPGDDAPASPANVGQRVAALRRIRLALLRPDRQPIACITTGEALGRAYAVPGAFETAPPHAGVGDPIDLPGLFDRLIECGYISDERVDEPGEVALRGQVLDVYPADAEEPLRIETAEDRIVSIRSYDPGDQRTTGERQAEELGRVSEPPIEGAGVILTEHLPDATLAIEPGAEDRRKRFLALAADADRRRPKRAVRSIADEAMWQAAIRSKATLTLDSAGDPPPRFVEGKAPLRAFAKFVLAALDAGERVVLLGSARDLRFLRARAAKALKRDIASASAWTEVLGAAPGSLLALEAPVDHGFRREGIVAIAAADLLGSRAERDDAQAASGDIALFGLGEIRIGDVIVHEDHGIGVVAGMDRMPETGSGEPGDAIAITYADNGVRLVPMAEADRLWRYGADADAVTLDKLDGSSWEKRRATIHAAIAETAEGMTRMAADRADSKAPVLDPDTAAYERFAAGFPYSETRDQARAIDAVRADLVAGKPMDRLVVGDVGFGKTEVALRAAALAALAGHQVAIAAPTTVLARQHIETFSERFEGTGIVVAGLSRLSSTAEKKQVKAGLEDGTIHIVVGTAAVASKSVTYKSLALVIVDEEQRFGAADKTRLRELGAGHVLTLSATPIPRTLQNALVGIQQLSVIGTPPARRQPIRTAVSAFDKETVRAALLRERSRGGQSFVVVPRIEDMAALAETLAKLVPELEVLQAHGKLPAAEIDEAMIRFGRGEGDVLLATNIIEAGLDVPRANTMVITRADRFGLSQLHQLRGRVGRGSRRGQVLLMTEPDKEIAPGTLKRLRTLEAFDRLGAGFAISARDLDMRGAGDLLGEVQAGHMKLIGIDLYQHLLETALRTARGETVERWTPELHLGIEGSLPETWMPDPEFRVMFHVRLARTESADQIDALQDELEDRFGALPEEATTLLSIARVRANARSAKIARIDAGPGAIAFTPRPDFSGDGRDTELTNKGGRLLLAERIEDPVARLAKVEDLLNRFVSDEQ